MIRHGSASGRESGQVTIMVIGLVVVAALLAVVVVTSTRAYLTRRALVSYADGAALTAAQEVSEESVYRDGLTQGVPLGEAAARAAVTDYVARNGLPGRFDDFGVTDVSVTRAGTVRVAFAARSPVAFFDVVTSAYAGGVPISVDATAESILG